MLLIASLQPPNERHPVAGLPLERPVRHQPLEELVALGHADQPGDLLHLLPRALRREVHQPAKQHGHGTGVGLLGRLAVSLLLRRRDAEGGDVVQLGLAVRVERGVDVAKGGFADLRTQNGGYDYVFSWVPLSLTVDVRMRNMIQDLWAKDATSHVYKYQGARGWLHVACRTCRSSAHHCSNLLQVKFSFERLLTVFTTFYQDFSKKFELRAEQSGPERQLSSTLLLPSNGINALFPTKTHI